MREPELLNERKIPMQLLKQLTEEFKLQLWQVENTVSLIDEGNTIPFIARYRKERTGSLDDTVLRDLFDRLTYLRSLQSRKEEVMRLIAEQEKLTEEITKQIEDAVTLTELEDIYRPFRPKRRTRATIAKEKGLEPLAEILWKQQLVEGSIEEITKQYIDEAKEVYTLEDALAGAMDIIAEKISDDAELRKKVREMTMKKGVLLSKALKEEDSVYAMYYDYKENVRSIAGHRILAVNRGEREKFLSVKVEAPEDEILMEIKRKKLHNKNSITIFWVEQALEDSYKRLIQPSIEREIRNELTEKAEEGAMKVFAENLKRLLLQPPVKGKVVLGFDPGFRTGCKIAAVDETGKVLEVGVVYPTPPQKKIEEAEGILKKLIEKYDINIIAIGNGTASRESEIFIADLLKKIDKKIYYMVVSEAGASVYSASKLGAEEFPDFDVALRSAVSIARRLQDPLAELVKIDPKSIGVGQYQHDMNQKRLSESLHGVVEDSVNRVGVDLNTASPSLLQYIVGISAKTAKAIVEHRESIGKFIERKQLLKVKGLGPKAFTQCAGFLRISEGDYVLDNTAVHPESYEITEGLLKKLGYTLEDIREQRLQEFASMVSEIGIEQIAEELKVGVPTLKDIIQELIKPGRDPRDELPRPLLRTDIMGIEDLKPNMIIEGTVRNVMDFGAFIDIGVHHDGLVHISEISDRFVKHPLEVVSVGDIVKARVLDVDTVKMRISLSMKKIDK